MREIYSRRGLMAMIGGVGVAVLSGCDSSTGPSVSSSGAPAADGTEAAGQVLVSVPANAAFAFKTDLTNRGTGESSPITADYWIGQYQVTNAQYKQFLDAGAGSAPKYWSSGAIPSGKESHPVLYVSAKDADAYCAWLTGKADGWNFRLPTEAEWENAARGPQGYSYPWGNDAGTTYADGKLTSKYTYNGVCAAYALATYGSRQATYDQEKSARYGQSDDLSDVLSVSADGGVQGWIDHDTWTGFVYTDIFAEISAAGGYTTAVGSYPDGRSHYGCHDLAGNAFEWTSSLVTATNGAEAGKQVNAVRGGSWYSTGRSCQTSYRGEGRDATGGYNTIGFRVAATKA